MHIVFDSDIKKLRKKAALQLDLYLKEYKNNPVLLLLSGGSALTFLDFVNIKHLSKHVTISMLDERFDLLQNQNIFGFKSTSFYKNAVKNNCVLYDTGKNENDTLPTFTKRFEHFHLDWKKKNQSGKIIITQGMGEDGHTAGIFPMENKSIFTKYFEDKKRIAFGYDAKDKNVFPLRMTVTNIFLRDWVDASILFVVGKNKEVTFQQLIRKEVPIFKMPAQIIHEMKNVTIFTDLGI